MSFDEGGGRPVPVPRGVLNLLARIGFLAGAVLVIGRPPLGCGVFAAGAAVCAVDCVVELADDTERPDGLLRSNVLLQQFIGAVILGVSSAAALLAEEAPPGFVNVGFLSGSQFFLSAALMSHFSGDSLVGELLPYWPNQPPVVPTTLFTTAGSVMFFVGSIECFISRATGEQLYLLGSVLFVVSAWCTTLATAVRATKRPRWRAAPPSDENLHDALEGFGNKKKKRSSKSDEDEDDVTVERGDLDVERGDVSSSSSSSCSSGSSESSDDFNQFVRDERARRRLLQP